MSLPLWWSRTTCVYCGRRLDPDPLATRTKRSLLACWRHVKLLQIDPLYALPATKGKGSC